VLIDDPAQVRRTERLLEQRREAVAQGRLALVGLQRGGDQDDRDVGEVWSALTAEQSWKPSRRGIQRSVKRAAGRSRSTTPGPPRRRARS
jgi:hypothetical protein